MITTDFTQNTYVRRAANMWFIHGTRRHKDSQDSHDIPCAIVKHGKIANINNLYRLAFMPSIPHITLYFVLSLI